LQALSKTWPITEQMVKSKPAGPVEVSIVQSINEVIDMNPNASPFPLTGCLGSFY
jgi:hypothetical protein